MCVYAAEIEIEQKNLKLDIGILLLWCIVDELRFLAVSPSRVCTFTHIGTHFFNLWNWLTGLSLHALIRRPCAHDILGFKN